MNSEKSCGAVIFKEEAVPLFLIIQSKQHGHYSFPKGHIEENESEIECAYREIKEETNLDVVFIDDFYYIISYSPKAKTKKEVIYFLANPISDQIVVQDEEVSDYKWLDFESALHLITFENEKEVLKAAYEYIIDS